MVKSSKEQLVEDERKVLAELQKNSNESIDILAKHCGFSRQKAWRLIKQLEASHKIWGYSVIVDVEKQGLQKFIMFFKQAPNVLSSKTADKVNLDEIKKNYLEFDITIETSYYIHGEYDWVVIFIAKNINQAKKFLNLLLNKYPGLIEKVNLSQILYTPRDHCILNPSYLKVKEFM